MKYLIALIITTATMVQAFAQVPPSRRPGYCPLKQSTSCEEHVMKNLPWYDQNEEDIQKSVKNACAGNLGNDCLKLITTNLSWYENKDDMIILARACQLASPKCVNWMKKKASRWEFKSIARVTKIANACARVEVSCLEKKCATREYNCKHTEDLLRAGSQCYKLCATNGYPGN